LRSLPDNALLLPAYGTVSPEILAVECDPQIITLPGATAGLAAADDLGIAYPVANPDSWPSPQPAPRWPPQRG
jgi:hypothetical protein